MMAGIMHVGVMKRVMMGVMNEFESHWFPCPLRGGRPPPADKQFSIPIRQRQRQ
jgi:hypothetical protein